ncbi:hypothetical protein E3P99_01820 [Wallemia hederae]|uniref:Calcineurin-like phosphoesterase domain-containing protein n=1 Tax=Wallemia hederae TaxID=1540922 RepID=A0A4T0FMS4_9BASI|nr:hypothetical protein E3P99_01820 [Wallemia hederae]
MNSNIVDDKFAVYFKYNVQNLPPKLINSTRFIVLSDTHNRVFSIPDGDILIHAGDLTALYDVNFDITAKWLLACQIKTKVIVAGNHDLMLLRSGKPHSDGSWDVSYTDDYDPQAIDSLCGDIGVSNGLYYLQNTVKQVHSCGRTWRILGSPLYPSRRPTKHTATQALKTVSRFEPMDVLITHGPPHNILDKTQSNLNVGCVELTDALPRLRPKLHVFGHIHESRGCKVVWHDDESYTIHINAANSRVFGRYNGESDHDDDELNAVIVDIVNDY